MTDDDNDDDDKATSLLTLAEEADIVESISDKVEDKIVEESKDSDDDKGTDAVGVETEPYVTKLELDELSNEPETVD